MTAWSVDPNPHYTHATRRDGTELIEVSLDDEHLDIDYEIGAGFMRESAKFSIPMSVIAQLFAARGYELRPAAPPLPSSGPQAGEKT